MPFRLYKMDLKGKVAFGNLGLIGLALLVFRIASPHGLFIADCPLEAMRAVATAALHAVFVLGFPVGWLSTIADEGMPHAGPVIFAAIFLPLNAYLWGHFVAWVVKRCKSRPTGVMSVPREPSDS